MSKLKHIGLDVHQASISVAVLDESGKLVMQSVIATRAAAILEFLNGLRGTLQVTFEEGTYSAWLYDLLVRRVSQVVVCNPRKNALLKKGNKSDRIDALKLAELLRGGMLSPVYHGENSTRTLQELARSYRTLTVDTGVATAGMWSARAALVLRSSCLCFQFGGVEAVSFLPDGQSDGGDLARQRQAGHLRLEALGFEGEYQWPG
jgi:hypothetical protein